jgi:NADH-quinone oxidoreductase subunit N
MYVLAIIGVLTSAIAAFYYLKIIKVMYFDEPEMPLDRMVSAPSTLVLGACFVVTVGYFLYPTFLVAWSETAAKALLY